MPQRIAIQGCAGAFHDLAAHHYWSHQPIEILPCNTFTQLIRAVECGDADFGLMAIENSIAGSLLANYQLLHSSELVITGEIYLRIKQNLLALPGTRIEDIEEVRSHPVALAQCDDFFEKHPQIRLVEAIDTALAARQISEEKLPRTAAVASLRAAELYGLEVLAEEIETSPRNFTRFLALSIADYGMRNAAFLPTRHQSEIRNPKSEIKVSLLFEVNHTVGSLHRVLAALADNRCNLTKILSAPMVGNEWHYLFFVDFLLENAALYDHLLAVLADLTENLRVLGRYPEGQHFE